MSELIQKNDNRATIRWKLLTGASALALAAYVSAGGIARAEDTGHPLVWIELGGQFSRLQDSQETFAPPFLSMRPSIFDSSQKFERPSLYSLDEMGKISFQPDSSDWLLSASVRYGRSGGKRHVHQQTYPQRFGKYVSHSGVIYSRFEYPVAAKFADTNARNSERHLVLDFQAGKDVGLGLFGRKDVASTVSFGVRFAQFKSKSNVALKSDPDWHFHYLYYPSLPSFGYRSSKLAYGQVYHNNLATFRATRSFHGVGPSISWNASVPFAGNLKNGELDFDFGVNGALLFGRQKTKTQHQTSQQYHPAGLFSLYYPAHQIYHHPSNAPAYYNTRSRNVTVPNVGGFAGISFNYDDAKITLGYKADFFFNALDGGIDARKSENRAFYGPYVSISIGLGD